MNAPDPRTGPLTDPVADGLLRQRIVVLDEALDDRNGTRIIGQLFLLSAEDHRSDITLWINSPGGSVPAMLAIMDTMRLIPNDVSTLAIGMAASAGQFLLSAGTPGKRYALRHARILMHQGSAGIGGNAVDIALQAEDLRHTRDTVLGLIAEHTGQPLERVVEDSQRDRWFTAEQSLEYGFVDAVLDSLDRVRPVQRTPVGLTVRSAR